MQDDPPTLREFLSQRLDSQEAATVAQWLAHERQHDEQRQAVQLAAGLMGQRLDTMNEFRVQLDRQAALFITRDQLAALLDALRAGVEKDEEALRLAHDKDLTRVNELAEARAARIELLEKRNANQDGRFAAVACALAVVAFALPLVLHYLFP